MKLQRIDPPRTFVCGVHGDVSIRDCARIELEPDEQVTFLTDAGAEYDVARKSWGFYATPSLNARLVGFGLRGALVENWLGRRFVLLVERGHEGELETYLAREQNRVVEWLDVDPRAPRCICGGHALEPVFSYDARPAGETAFPWSSGAYRRSILRCARCAHHVSVHSMDEGALYSGGGYVTATYGDAAGLRRAFDRIAGLDPARSDNAGRVARIVAFAREHLPRPEGRAPSVLDVGSGLCVFLHRMKAEGWDGTALDPDPRAAEHAREVVGVRAVAGDFMAEDLALGTFDLVTFNKVLEHVRDPVALLARAARFLAPGGLVYVELPDAEGAAREGKGREEFFIEHHHVFSMASIAVLVARAGFAVRALERLREPSGKLTLRAFASRPG